MLLRFFRLTSTPVIIVVPLLGLLLWMPSFFHQQDYAFFFDKAQMPLYKFVVDFISPKSFTATFLTFLLVIVQGFLLVRLNTRLIFINNRSYLPALFFILITASVPDLQRLNPVIFSCFFLLLALEKIFVSYQASKLAYDYFTAAFYISVGSMFYPFLAFFFPVIWISLAIMKPFNWREWLFTILGFLLPVFFVSSYYYLLYNQPLRIISDINAAFGYNYKTPEYPLPVVIFFGVILFLIVLASQFILRTFAAKKILPRKAFTIFFWLFINAILVYLFVSKASIEIIFLAAIPVSYLLAHYFALLKSIFWGNIFIISLFILLLVIQTW
jgi:hypothetical protein